MPGGASEGSADGDGDGETDGEGEAGRRRRRRRGGRGRGRGRGRDGEALPAGDSAAPTEPAAFDDDEDADEEEDVAPAPRGPRTTPFGSVWDSQIGTPTSAPASLGPVADDEDFDEPEIPEYLIAEQRRGRQGQAQGGPGSRGGQGRGGPRGGRSAYNAAIDRERYGRGGGGGINRYPDVSGRTGQGGRPAGQPGGAYARQDASYSRPQGDRPERSAPRSNGDPWSEVPPELEQQLRAQLAQSPKARRPERAPAPSRIEAADAAGEIETMTVDALEAIDTAPKRRASTRRKAGDPTAAAPEAASDTAAASAPKRRATTRKKADDAGTAAAAAVDGAGEAATAAPKRRATTRKKADPSDAAGTTATEAVDSAAQTDAAPKRRAPRNKADPA